MPIDKITVSGGTPTPDPNNSNPTRVAVASPTLPIHKSGLQGMGGGGRTRIPYAKGGVVGIPLMKKAQLSGQGWNAVFSPPNFFSPIHTPQQWQIASKRREIYQWSRHWYENEPKVAAGIDFYAQFPMCGFKLECPSSKIKRYYEKVVRDLKLAEWLLYISHEYFLIGDVFPMLEIDCPHCGGSGTDEDGEICVHHDGKFRRLTILNPDYIEIQKTPLDDRPEIYMIPDDQIKMIVQKRIEPIYSRLSPYIRDCVARNLPIRISNRVCSHISHNKSPYGLYGSSLLRRLFTTLSYKTKLMTANWIIAERLVLPIRVVKVGDKDRPATGDDIADLQSNLAAVSQDPNLTIVTHHAVEFDWVGATGRIHNIQGELELIGKEILDGFMLNQALLNGEMGHYSSAQVGVEAILHRLESWRNKLAEWVYEHIFEPIARMQGFVDVKKTKEIQEVSGDEDDVHYLFPKIKWNDMQLRDNTQQMQIFIQLNQEGKISNDTLLKKLDLDWDEEVEKMRNEQATVGPGGAMGGANPAASGGTMGVGGGGGAGMPGGDAGGMGGGMDPTGGMGGGMGGAPGMAGGAAGAAPGGGGMAAAAGAMPGMQPKIGKRGSKKQDEEMPQQQTSTVRLTKLEAKVMQAVEQLQLPYQLFAQFKVNAPGTTQPYRMDFAFPQIKVDIEADGQIWHQADAEAEDAQRDQNLAQMGWRVLRFPEDAINERIDDVAKVIYANAYEAAQEQKAHAKTASGSGQLVEQGYVRLVEEETGKLLGVLPCGYAWTDPFIKTASQGEDDGQVAYIEAMSEAGELAAVVIKRV